MNCAGCSAPMAEGSLVCGQCGGLVHRERLESLSERARAAAGKKHWSEAEKAWTEALALLPPNTRQYQVIEGRIAELAPLAVAQENDRRGLAKWLAALGPVGLLAWKFKAVLLFAVTKAKLLLLGLTKLTTLSTMLLSLGLYWQMYGWWFALGIVLSIYVHEMGHVSELRKYGIPATAPMFIPGFGALVLLKARPATPGHDARVGLAGPVWGTAAAVACLAAFLLTGNEFWRAMARWGAWINLFNLLPIWQLDGGRAFVALTRRQRMIALVLLLGLWIWTEDMLLLVLAGGALFRTIVNDGPVTGDTPILVRYSLLVLVLGLLCLLPETPPPRPS